MRLADLKEITYLGKPGNVCIVLNSDKRFEGLPSHGLAWGLFDEAGKYKLLVNPVEHPVLIMIEKLPKPEVFEHLEKYWNVNSA